MTYFGEDHRIDQAKRYRKRRAKIIAHLGGECVVCKTTRRLQVHHKNPKTKSFNISKRYDDRWSILVKELKKCELRCRKHHKEAHATTHGTLTMYSHHRCRCAPCRQAWNSYHSALKKRKVVPVAGLEPATNAV